MKVIIVGAGETGLTLATLLGEDYDIVLLEKEDQIAKETANKISAMVVKGDATDITILKEAGLDKVDAIVICTGDDKTNLMICQIALTEKVKKIISLVNSAKNEELFTKLGITSLVSVVGTNVAAIKNMLYHIGDARVIAALGGGEVQLIELIISKNSKLIGQKAQIKEAIIATIYRKGELIIPDKTTVLKEGDLLLVAVKTKHLSKVAKIITGK
ncbi:MAG: NAD-binding protein [Nanoarchaeota archaeon]|nr:NAD-binding protein [Nanoarchaeota archaeon]